MNSTNPAEFEAYLRRFPNGMFSELAQIRLEVLRTTPVPAAVAGARAVGNAGTPALPFPIEFGDDTSDWARDGECDDIRFEGDGMASSVIVQNRGRDAADCRRLYDEGRVRLFGVNLDSGAIDFGDDASDWAQDGECDDPRFEGDGMNSLPLDSDRGHDATDCRRLSEEGRIRLFGVNLIAGRSPVRELPARRSRAKPRPHRRLTEYRLSDPTLRPAPFGIAHHSQLIGGPFGMDNQQV